MKRLLTLFIFLLSLPIGHAGNLEKKDPFLKKTDSLNNYLSVYETLSPRKDSDYERIVSCQEHISRLIIELLNDQKSLQYKISELIKSNAISISCSSDERLYFLSIDEQTGGSYRSNITWYYFRFPGDSVICNLLPGDHNGSSTSVYSYVYVLDSITHAYLALGSVITCNSCANETAMIIRTDSGQIDFEVIYSVDSRTNPSPELNYDPTEKILSYDYTVYQGDQMYDTPEEYGDDIKLVRMSGAFFYNGTTFARLRTCEAGER